MNSDNIFFITNIRTNVQEDSSEFEALIQETISFEIFSNQEICHINLNGKKRVCTVSTYIKEYLSIVEIENKKCQICCRLKTPYEALSDKLTMFLEGLLISNKSRHIDHKKYTSTKKGTLLFWIRFSINISMIHCYTM